MASTTAEQIVEQVGGPGNISALTHCATRLRFELKDASVVDQSALEKIPGVLGAVPQSGDRYQVVAGLAALDRERGGGDVGSPRPCGRRVELDQAAAGRRTDRHARIRSGPTRPATACHRRSLGYAMDPRGVWRQP